MSQHYQQCHLSSQQLNHLVDQKNPALNFKSNLTLGASDCSVLQKGLSFCPTYRYRTFDLDMDLQRFFRSLRLKVYFSDPQNQVVNTVRAPTAPQLLTAESLGLRTKSPFRPPRGSHALETFIQFIQNSFQSLRGEVEMGRLYYPPNLTLSERQSLQSLQSDSSLIIKPADKGGAIVIMDKSDYLREIRRQLDNTTVYQKLDSNPTQAIRNRISRILQQYTELGVLDLKTCNYLTNDHPVTPVFYTLPKIHKNVEHPPGRPIDQYYLQIRGTAMGSNVAPPYANCYMADFEETIIYSDSRFQDNVLLWKRYIDDIFCVWGGSLESFRSFVDFLNTAWPGISFTMAHDQHRMNFLDTVVIKDNTGKLSTDIHIKNTDRNSLLHFESLHPRAIKKAIPRSQIQRVTRIVTDNELRTLRVSEMEAKFLARGYPHSVLQESRTPSLNSRPKSNKRIPFVHSFHPFSYILHSNIRKHWHLLTTAHPNIPEFREPFLPCFRRPRNLRDTLMLFLVGFEPITAKQQC
ncbi:unnamed protein product [Ranitomeya imitator]|uniref:Helix-turn-helix domain-containing protein n=1 Tax=Ranitomeya imitator TaxID=111125 RepID=A0ABN9MAV3_9NEOB|nr:unnamed protein product [Ranitomeya imitator]